MTDSEIFVVKVSARHDSFISECTSSGESVFLEHRDMQWSGSRNSSVLSDWFSDLMGMNMTEVGSGYSPGYSHSLRVGDIRWIEWSSGLTGYR